jgi:hypothetical protein
MLRAPVTQIDAKDALEEQARSGPTFVLNVASKDASIIQAWEQAALDHLDTFSFFVTHEGSALSSSLGTPPSVHIKAPKHSGLDPLPFNQEFNQVNLQHWANFNRFPSMSQLDFHNTPQLKKSDMTVVCLVYGNGSAGEQTKKAFEAKAGELRSSGKYLFALANADEEEPLTVLKYDFPLLLPDVSPLPRLFAFSGDRPLRYWEDPTLTSSEALTSDVIDALLLSSEALQDGSTGAWLKQHRKKIVRMATRSTTSMILAIVVPIVSIILIVMCCRLICDCGDDDEYYDRGKARKVD